MVAREAEDTASSSAQAARDASLRPSLAETPSGHHVASTARTAISMRGALAQALLAVLACEAAAALQLPTGRLQPLRPLRSPPPAPLMAFWSPPPPPPPAPFAGIDAIRRDAPVYLGMLALGFLPALDLSGIEGAAASARIGFVFSIAVGTVYLGCRRQDMQQDDVSSVSLENAAFAPVFASLSLGGLYLLIRYTGLDAGALLKVSG